ncbi:lipoyl(octanoyl) transferase LipB [Oerskovia turbata]|uniref:Octanoyltransferase n=1 Tax=Oerskovia turbata TaxID=1713 RepID=A0A4Q1KNR5_9CELL|nr:lipoyl(octanoyl) transferase LipB [Oerskovia turbata]RXR23108.1 lipoyl(octanoyl) transferase LipB [Oerskovia turbata]RXR31693.1 lipoyl(octanoyl) transferase LipB [Oerskovia turbata]TGJ97228.1 lipoyl(octanoyl) transferase LipB [Actinotalea fermentans ATCC 43279 = JCM 9966 = DSM 3133]
MHLRTEGPGLTDYQDAWDLQRLVHQEVVDGTAPDTVILVEHRSVYTAGRRTNLSDRPDDGTPVIDVDRGGKITWHGPGQLVAYPIVRLAEPVDVVAYVRALESAVMDVCAALGLATHRVDGRSGVWLAAAGTRRERKICAIGVRVARGVTMHGLALNCCPDLGEFSRIVPCGISDADVTSLTLETGRQVTLDEATPLLVAALHEHLGPLLAATTTTGATTTTPAASVVSSGCSAD